MRDEGASPWETDTNMARHVSSSVSTIAPRENYNCSKCPGVTISSESARRTHDRYYHEDKSIDCVIDGCQKKSQSTALMLNHILFHHEKPDVLFCKCCLFWCDTQLSYERQPHWDCPRHRRNLEVTKLRDPLFVEIQRPPVTTLLSQIAEKYLSVEEAKAFKERQRSSAPQSATNYLIKTIPTVLEMSEGSPPPLELPEFDLLPDIKLSHTAKVVEGTKGTSICTINQCAGTSHPYLSGVLRGGENFIDTGGYRLKIDSHYDDDTRRCNYLIRCNEHILMRCVGKTLGKIKHRIGRYLNDIDDLYADRVKKEPEIEKNEGQWRRLTESEFRELLFGYNEETGKRFFKYSLVSAHFAGYDCGLHNIYFSVLKSFEYVKGKGHAEVKKEVAQGEKYFQFMLDSCDNSTMGCNIRAEYVAGENPKDLLSFMCLVGLNMAKGSQFKKDQAKYSYKNIFPGLKNWELKENEIEWEEQNDDDDSDIEESDEPTSSKKSKIDPDS